MSYSSEIKQMLLEKNNKNKDLNKNKCCQAAFDYALNFDGEINLKNIFACENCEKAFFRGIFLKFGSVSNPEKAYHLEISLNFKDIIKSQNCAKEFQEILINQNIFFKIIKRNNNFILYLKSSEQIENFLYYINAEKFAFEFMNAKILKEIRNQINRATNFESANIYKMSKASIEQIQAIEILKNSGKFANLSEELKKTAEIRLENIELNLREIAEMSGASKSAVAHRMRKILDLAGM